MRRLFAELAVWEDSVAREGPAQMACDEVLLRVADAPVLRIFRWARPWVSAGCFVPWAEACAARPDLPVCRRWTGGGIVIHDGDFTFTLVAPRSEPWTRLRPADSYFALHRALTESLQAAGCPAALSDNQALAAASCFAGPVRHDVMLGDRKIAGGAQRRTKAGLLHQGSLQQDRLPADFAWQFAARMAETTDVWSPPQGIDGQILALQMEKYAREDFLHGAGAGRG